MVNMMDMTELPLAFKVVRRTLFGGTHSCTMTRSGKLRRKSALSGPADTKSHCVVRERAGRGGMFSLDFPLQDIPVKVFTREKLLSITLARQDGGEKRGWK